MSAGGLFEAYPCDCIDEGDAIVTQDGVEIYRGSILGIPVFDDVVVALHPKDYQDLKQYNIKHLN